MTSDKEGEDPELLHSTIGAIGEPSASYSSTFSSNSSEQLPIGNDVFVNEGKTAYERFVINFSRSIISDLAVAMIGIKKDKKVRAKTVPNQKGILKNLEANSK